MWLSNPLSVIGMAGLTYPTSVCAQSERPSLIQFTSSESSYCSSRCWYSWAKTPSYRCGRAGALVHASADGLSGGLAPVRCGQSNASIVITLRSKNPLICDEKNPAMYVRRFALFVS